MIAIEHLQHSGGSRSASLMLPEIILQGIDQGRELGNELAKLTGVAEVRYPGANKESGSIIFYL